MIPLFTFSAFALLATGLTLMNMSPLVQVDAAQIGSITSITSGAALLYMGIQTELADQKLILIYTLMFVNPLLILQYASAIGYAHYYSHLWPLCVQSVFLAITGGAAMLERYVWKTPRWLWSTFVHVILLAMYYATAAITVYRINDVSAFDNTFMYGPVVAFFFGSALLPAAVLSSDSTFRNTLIASMFLFQQVAFNVVLAINFT
jgi:hypothetical protein